MRLARDREAASLTPPEASWITDPRLIQEITPCRAGVLVAGSEPGGAGDCVTVTGRTLRLNSSARAIWDLCDGNRGLEEIARCLGRTFHADPGRLARDVESTVVQMLESGLLHVPFHQVPHNRRIDLGNIRFFVINCKDDVQRRQFMAAQMDRLGLSFEFVPGVRTDPPFIGKMLSHLKVLQTQGLEPPFAVLEDDCQLDWDMPGYLTLPADADALYLGNALHETETPDSTGRIIDGRCGYNPLDDAYLRIFNTPGTHAVVYLSQAFHREATDALLNTLTSTEGTCSPDTALMALQMAHKVVTPRRPFCYQAEAVGGREFETRGTLCASEGVVDVCALINYMEIARLDGEAFHLFLDIFVHWDRKHITAVCPYYGSDIDWKDYGIDLENVTLEFDGGTVTAKYVPYRLDSWEPSIVLDFECEELARQIACNAFLDVVIRAGGYEKRFCLAAEPPQRFDCAMSVIIRDENRWIRYYLDYYIRCMGVNHVYVYDNGTRDFQSLKRILSPYIERNQATLLPWRYRWRNRDDGKQIGQPPQQTHTLNRFGGSNWIGFFDVDEFLRIPGYSIPQFLRQFDPDALGGVSFGLRWFMYKGTDTLEQVGNPLLCFLHSKRDPLGRKRQKLFVSPRNVRFMRFHWIQEDQKELAVDDDEIFFHHYYLRPQRFESGLDEDGAEYDDYMLRFADILEPLDRIADESVNTPIPANPATVQDWIDHVDGCLERAQCRDSALRGDVLEIEGMCGTLTRHFYNNLCRFTGCRYLEIGSFQGASLCAAMYDNAIYAVSIENWSQFSGPRRRFWGNIARFRGASRVTHLQTDCFSMDVSRLGPFNVYLYDGRHEEADHYRAMKRYVDTLDDIAVVVVDDWDYRGVRDGMRRAIAELDMPVIHEREIFVRKNDDRTIADRHDKGGWWNGLLVMVIDNNSGGRYG